MQNTQFSKPCSKMKFWKTSAKPSPERHVLDLMGGPRFGKVRNKLAVCSAHPHGPPSLFEVDWVQRVRCPPVFSFRSTTVGFVILTKATITPTSKCIYKCSVCRCNWHKTQTAPGRPASPFTLQHFKLLQAELPETVVTSWHWEFP